MSRSKWKGIHIEKQFLNEFLKNNQIVNKSIELDIDKDKVKLFDYKDNLRNSTIIPSFVGFEFLVFNGRNYNSVIVNSNMIGYKFGYFSLVSRVGYYEGRRGMVIRKYNRAVRKVNEKRARRARRAQKLMEKDD